jgi:hypothetical protein
MIELPKEWICLGKKKLSADDFNPIQNRDDLLLKPAGGLWICPYTPNDEYISPWHEWCTNENFRQDREGTIIALSEELRVYVIDSQRDLIAFIDEVGEAKKMKGLEHFKLWKCPDYEEAAKEYDLIYLTERGQWATHLPLINPEYTLYGWDCACALVLSFSIVESQREIRITFPEDSEKSQTHLTVLQQIIVDE